MELTAPPGTDNYISNAWEKMAEEKGDLIDRSRAYARWTVPAVMPAENGSKDEQDKGSVLSGARLVNHLSNRVVDVMFPVSKPFFTVALTAEAKVSLEQKADPNDLPTFLAELTASTANLEKVAMRNMNLTRYRPKAILAAKHLIITGNALLKRMPSGDRVLYPIDRYSCRRDIEGNEIEVILHDKKQFKTFPKDMQTLITTNLEKAVKPEDDVILLTHYVKQTDGRWEIRQEADGINIGTKEVLAEKDYDLLLLYWSLNPGENYGRGLVEDNAAIFHALDVTTEAANEMMAIVCDIKFFVRTGSQLAMDIENLNKSPRGSYFPGNEGDIHVPDLGNRQNLETILGAIQKWEQDLAQIFLLSKVRDAERVTAEEIRLVANELESSFGGLYSLLALSWQQREADWIIAQTDIAGLLPGATGLLDVVVTTGLESLSREGQLDNLRLAIGDLQMLQAVPEELRATINPLRFANFVFTNRSVDITQFLQTEEEMQAETDRQMALASQDQQQQAAANVQEHAGKSAVDNANQ